jgi:hypothetical protein
MFNTVITIHVFAAQEASIVVKSLLAVKMMHLHITPNSLFSANSQEYLLEEKIY